jgi:hypothetical protein
MPSVVSLTEAMSQVMGRVLASVGAGNYGTVTDPERWPTGEIQDAVIDADGVVCSWFLQKAGDGRRVGFLQTVTVANGGTIPSHIGEIESILLNGKMPIRSDPTTIQRDRDAALVSKGSVLYTPKIFLWGSTLMHNYTGGGATVQIVDYVRNGAACQGPSEYSAPVIALATANIIAKNGNHTDAAETYLRIGLSYLSPVTRGETNLAPLPTHDEIRRMVPQVQAAQQ